MEDRRPAPAVTVTPARQADGPELIRANLAARDHHAPWATPFTTEEGFDVWYGRLLTGADRGFVAREPQTGEIVGVVNLSGIVWGLFRSAYLGYYGMPGPSGRGLMTAAVAEVVRQAFEEIGLHRLEANIQPGNAASLALVRRLGFRREGFSPRYLRIGGVWCDHERWARLADEAIGDR
jgi:[ribosomal protein S5]-alanine N-acetyltransferase